MHRLVRIEGLHNFKYGAYLKFVLYDGSKYITLKGYIHKNNHIVFENHHIDSSKLFKGFGIMSDETKLAYCKKYDHHCSFGYFPEHSSLNALKKTLLSFFDLNQDIEISSTYSLREDAYDWSAAMFKGKIEELESNQKDSIKITSIEDSIVSFTDNCKITLYLTGNYYQGVLDVLRKLHQPLIGGKYGSTFHSRITCSSRDTCYEPEVIDNSLLWVILDYLKYYFGTEECKKTINPGFYQYLIEKPKQGIVEQIEYSQVKTQKHAYRFRKTRGTVCRGDVPEGRTVQGKRSKASISSRPLAYGTAVGW